LVEGASDTGTADQREKMTQKTHDFKLIDDALEALDVTQAEFSRRYLGKSHGYVSAIKASGTPPSTCALSHLSQRLRLQLGCLNSATDLPAVDALKHLLAATDEVLMRRALNACTRPK
jgi:hypothetical protein